MGRVTRAKAAEIAEKLHIDDDDVLALGCDLAVVKPATPEPSQSSRAPLGELAPNSAESKENGGQDQGEALKGEGKTRKGPRKGKGNKEFGASTATPPEDVSEVAHVEVVHSPSREEELAETSQTDDAGEMQLEVAPYAPLNAEVAARPGSPVASATPKVIRHLRKDTPGKRSTSNKENVEPVMQSPAPRDSVSEHSAPAELTQVPSTPPAQIELQPQPPDSGATGVSDEAAADTSAGAQQQHAIEDLGKLNEDVEKVSKESSAVQLSLEKKPKASSEKRSISTSKPAPVVKTTKATQARLSMAHNSKTDTSKRTSLGRPKPCTGLGRSTNFRQSTATVPSNNKRVTSTSSNLSTFRSSRIASDASRERKEVMIPHSKPRPISLSFPTPPPPPKSTKPATKSSFQLPGEAVAAKLKAAREQRLAQDAASSSQATNPATAPAFKARPAPDMLKKTPSVRHTATSRARESVISGAAPVPTATGSAKRSSIVPGSRPRPMGMHVAPTGLQNSKRATARPSTAADDHSRLASAKPTVNKGKAVFDRAANAKANAEKEKQEKEENAKRARAAAAERSRLMSREWAEKQKAKKAGTAAAAAAAAPGTAVESS